MGVFQIETRSHINNDVQPLPMVIASSVVRSTHIGESHGGVYLVDLKTGSYQQVIDWNDNTINWEGRGGERGLRGIAFNGEHVYLAASSQILMYDKRFNPVATYSNQYLGQCHEIFIAGRSLFIASTGFDSILEFDMVSERFVRGYCARPFEEVADVFKLDPVSRSLTQRSPAINGNGSGLSKLSEKFKTLLGNGEPKIEVREFDPESEYGPKPGDKYHINNVTCVDGAIYFSGTGLGSLFRVCEGDVTAFAHIPHGTHNVMPFRSGILFNETASNRLAFFHGRNGSSQFFSVPRYDEDYLLNSDLPSDFARQSFARGLCVTGDGLIIGGSSPATISVYSIESPDPIKTVNITMDVRNSIHGLEIWPYA